MPIQDLASVAVLTSLSAGVWTQLSAVPTPQEHGFDHLDVVWICDFKGTAKTALEVAAEFPLGVRYGTDDFWLRSGIPERLGGNVWKFAAHYEGRITSEKPMSVRFQSTNEVYNIDSLTYAGYTDAPANVREASPSVQLGYVLVGDSPPTNYVGLEGTPAVAPSVRAGFWGSLAAQRVNFPHNWILLDVDADKIAGSSPAAYWVSESWQHFQEFLPA